MLIQGCLAHYIERLLMVNIIKVFPGIVNDNNHQFQQMVEWIDDMMTVIRPNWLIEQSDTDGLIRVIF